MAKRVSRQEMLMEMAEVAAKRGTCDRAQVGVVISRQGRILVTGYNGAPAGMPHCDHASEPPMKLVLGTVPSTGFDISPGRVMVIPEPQMSTGCQNAEHAERNAIAFAARCGIMLDGSEMTCTHAPCLACARAIINAGILSVTYAIPYRLTEGIELLNQADIKVIRIGTQQA